MVLFSPTVNIHYTVKLLPEGCKLTLKLSINTLLNLFFCVVSHFHEPFVALVLCLSSLFNVVHSVQ